MHQVEGFEQGGRHRHGAIDAAAAFLQAFEHQQTRHEVDAIDRQRQGAVRLMWSSVVFRQGEYMSKLLLCATVLTGTTAAGTLVLLAGAAAAGGAAVVCCCRRSPDKGDG